MSAFTLPLSPSRRPNTSRSVSRRRALTLFGAAAGLTLIARDRAIALPEGVSLYTWEGTALGAPAKLTLAHYDRSAAQAIGATAIDEIERLERVFSLHRANSDLSILNRDGHIKTPAADLINLLSSSSRFGDLTDGAFDVTVQPLWRLFSDHFSKQPGTQTGPSDADIRSTLSLVDYRKIDITPGRVRFAKRDQGISQVLVELGETRALDDHPDGRPWRIGLADPEDPKQTTETVELINESVATSAGSGTVFGGDGRYHHLFDPRSGEPAKQHISASVITKRATTADAMSTALFVLPNSQVKDIVQKVGGMKAVTTLPGGVKHRFVS